VENTDLVPDESDKQDEVSKALRGRNLQFARLNRSDLHRADLTQADLLGAQMWDTRLEKAKLKYAKLQGAYLISAKLQGADLSSAQLQGAYLPQANLQGAHLRQAKLQGADLRFAKLHGADLARPGFGSRVFRLALLISRLFLLGWSIWRCHFRRRTPRPRELRKKLQANITDGKLPQGECSTAQSAPETSAKWDDENSWLYVSQRNHPRRDRSVSSRWLVRYQEEISQIL
jgi:hypothetical protein